MDPLTLTIIITIIAVVLVIDLYKRQNERITSNLHADNLKQFLTLSALEQSLSSGIATEAEPQLTVNEITSLISRYEHGEIQEEVFHTQMNHLLNKHQ